MTADARRPAHLLHVFATFTAAGPQVRTVRLIEALGDDFRHSIVPMDGCRDAADLLADGARVDLIDPPASGGQGPAPARALSELITRLSPNALLTYNWGSFDAVLAARRHPQLPLLHHEDGFNADEVVRQKLRRVWARRWFLRRAHSVVVPSWRLEQVARESWRLPADLVRLIPNGIDTDHFHVPDSEEQQARAALRQELKIGQEDWVIGGVGHLRPVKRFDRLIEACAAVPASALNHRPLHLLLVGDGSERAHLEQCAADRPPAGGRVHFIGHQRELRPWYHAMDLFALSSDSEQHPLALIEAMACGLPIAATDVGDVRRVLPESGHRALVAADARATEALSQVLVALLVDAPRRESEGRANRKRALEEYSFDRMLDRYRALYRELLGA